MSSTFIGSSSGRTSKGNKPAGGLAAAFNASFLVRLSDAFALMLSKQRSRIVLGQLDDRMLRDIGVDRATASAEAERSIWQ
jgi:uncharacterized protein YjiS (DUF1127 family)